MQVTSVASVAASTGGITSTDSINSNSQTLNQKDFLQLLVAQMQNQDPSNPQSDTQMAAQMAQFTSLSQSSAMSSSLAMLQANGLIGNTVTLQVDPKNSTSGTVQGVVMQNGAPEILVNGKLYQMNQVTAINPPSAAAAAGTTTGTTTSGAPSTN